MELEKYDGDRFIISQPLKINAELGDILSKLMGQNGYTTSAPLFRDLLWTSRKLLNRETIGKPSGNQQESLDNQRETESGNQSGNQFELIGKLTETPHNTDVLHGNTPHNTDVLHGNTTHNTDVLHGNTKHNTDVLHGNTPHNTDVLQSNTTNNNVSHGNTNQNTSAELSSDDFEERFTPVEIAPEQFRLYVRRLEDENVKLKSALEIADVALTAKIQEGNLSALLYQSENSIHGLIAWVDIHFREYFPNQNVPLMMLNDVRKIYPNFPHYQRPNPHP